METATLNVRVDAIHDEASDIRLFSVARIDGLSFDRYEPGAHIDVTSPAGITRQYSLCGDPGRRDVHTFAVKRETQSRGGSRSLHRDVQVGSELTIGVPRNLFQLSRDARDHMLIAAGIGITPLLSMAYQLVEQHAPFVLHYFARSKQHAAFVPLLSRPPFASHVQFHFGIERDRLDAALDACIAGAGDGTHLYTCGPGPFMDRVIEIGSTCVSDEAIHLERFAAHVPAGNPVASIETFEVRIASTGATVRVAATMSIVDALAAIGIEVETSCGEGVCGTCMVDVASGEPEHRDHCLSKAERASGKVICCCVSRSKSPVLVLDL